MKKFEYHVEVIDSDEYAEATLNALGDEGWDLVAVHGDEARSMNFDRSWDNASARYVFKRPKPAERASRKAKKPAPA